MVLNNYIRHDKKYSTIELLSESFIKDYDLDDETFRYFFPTNFCDIKDLVKVWY